MVKFPLYIGPCKQRVSLNHCCLSICHCFSKSDRSRWLFFSDVSVKLHYLKIRKLTALFCRIFFFLYLGEKEPQKRALFLFFDHFINWYCWRHSEKKIMVMVEFLYHFPCRANLQVFMVSFSFHIESRKQRVL